MWSVSQQFLDVVSSTPVISGSMGVAGVGGATDALYAENIRVCVKVLASDGTELSVANGSVNMDAQRSIVRTCTLEIIPSTMSSKELFDYLMTPGLELKVYRGVYVNDEPEYVPLGVFSADNVEMNYTVQSTVKFSGSDRSKKIAQAKFIDLYEIGAGADLATAVSELLVNRWSPTIVSLSNVSDTLGALQLFDAGESSNPWDNARKMMSDHGWDLNFNGEGVATAKAIPDPATASVVFDFGTGETNMVTGGSLKGTLDETYNGVVAMGEGTGVSAPVRYVAWDEDQQSPTFSGSAFGRVPMFYSSPLIVNETMAQVAAETLLAKVKGRAQQLSWPAIVNPALEPYDVVSVTMNGSKSLLVLDSLTIPLKASDPMEAVAREVKVY